jgi:OmpA-OmpF porin, OOP family
MQRSKLPYVFLALSACLAISALALLILRSKERATAPPAVGHPQPPTPPAPIANIGTPLSEDPTSSPTIKGTQPRAESNAEHLIQSIARALENGDVTSVLKLTEQASVDPVTAERLKVIAARRHSWMRPGAIRQVGETGENQTIRWALDLPEEERLYLDVTQNGMTWQVSRVTLTRNDDSPVASGKDPLLVADYFLQSVLKQQFEASKRHIAPGTISDAKIAGLCILFEEGKYALRRSRIRWLAGRATCHEPPAIPRRGRVENRGN